MRCFWVVIYIKLTTINNIGRFRYCEKITEVDRDIEKKQS